MRFRKTQHISNFVNLLLTTPRFGHFPFFAVPCRLTLCGLPSAVSVNLNTPVNCPVCVGLNLTVTTQARKGESVPVQWFWLIEKGGPLTVTLLK